jgi:hypothetical protein
VPAPEQQPVGGHLPARVRQEERAAQAKHAHDRCAAGRVWRRSHGQRPR